MDPLPVGRSQLQCPPDLQEDSTSEADAGTTSPSSKGVLDSILGSPRTRHLQDHLRVASEDEVASFLHFLREQGHGLIGAAWRRFFEDKQAIHVDFHRFNGVLFHVGYVCEPLPLFRALDHGRKRRITLEDVDPESAGAASYFARWCGKEFGGLLKIMRVVDRVGLGAVSLEDFSALLAEHGLFQDCDPVPPAFRSQDAFRRLFQPVLDAKQEGCVTEAALLWLEKDATKRSRMERQITQRRLFGAERSESQSAAGELLYGLAKASSGLGGKTWIRAAQEIENRLGPVPEVLLHAPPPAATARAASSRRSSLRSASAPSLAAKQKSEQSSPSSGARLPPIGESRRVAEPSEQDLALEASKRREAAARNRRSMRQLYRKKQNMDVLPQIRVFPKKPTSALPKVEQPLSVTQRCADFLNPMMARGLFQHYS
mmetsp:Transcript_21597/g.50402  ORF Transcript_21597/g.50402 Transcript_21597/m.50402 type:complete len:429 (+) Transcript_21597:64-1350(+)